MSRDHCRRNPKLRGSLACAQMTMKDLLSGKTKSSHGVIYHVKLLVAMEKAETRSGRGQLLTRLKVIWHHRACYLVPESLPV